MILTGREAQPLLEDLRRRAREGTHRHPADLRNVGDVRRVADEFVVQEHGLHEHVLGHMTLTPVGVVVHDDVARLEALFAELFHTQRDGVEARADDGRVHLGLAHHAELAVEEDAAEVSGLTEDRRVRGAHHGARHLVADVAERVVHDRERDRILLGCARVGVGALVLGNGDTETPVLGDVEVPARWNERR